LADDCGWNCTSDLLHLLGLQRSAARAASAAPDTSCDDAKDDAQPAPAGGVGDEYAKGVENGFHIVLLLSSAAVGARRTCIIDGTVSSRPNAERWEYHREKSEYDACTACELWAHSAAEINTAATRHRRYDDADNSENNATNGEAPEFRFVVILTFRITLAPSIGLTCIGRGITRRKRTIAVCPASHTLAGYAVISAPRTGRGRAV
jgi:hypothetical protein